MSLVACGVPAGEGEVAQENVEVREGALATFPWQLVGPSGYYDQSNSNTRFNGTVSEVKVFPQDSGAGNIGKVRAAGTAGGLFEWCPAPQCPTTTWINLTQSLVPTHSPIKAGEGIAISTFVANPADSYETIIAGTASALSQGSQLGTGIWKGVHSGSTWTWTNPKTEATVGNVRRLIWGGGGAATRINAATDTGYWYSTDTGATWTQFVGGCSGSLLLTDIIDYRGLYLLAAGKCSADSEWNLWKKVVGSGNWSRIHTLPTNATFAWLAVGQTNAYILTARSDNTGVVERYDGTTYYTSSTAVTQIGGQLDGGYNGAIAVDPTNDAIVYAGGQWMARNTTSGTGTWTGVGIQHPDVHQFYFSRSNNLRTMWIANDGGLHTSSNYTVASPSWSGGFNNFPMSHVTAIDVKRWGNDTVVYAQTWDSGMARGVDDDSGGATNNWQLAFNGLGDQGTVTMSPSVTGVVWASNLWGQRFMSTDNFVSTNVGMGTGLVSNGELIHDQVNPVFLYTLSGTEIYRSTDPSVAPPVFTKFGDAPSDPVGTMIMGVGCYDGTLGGSYIYTNPMSAEGIWVSPPGTTTAFTQSSAPVQNYAKIHGWIASTPNTAAAKTAFALGRLPTVVLRTKDGGTTWKNITGNFPTSLDGQDIIADPTNPDVVFVMAAGLFSTGIYKTSNASAASPTWSKWVAGLPAKGASAPATLYYGGGVGTQLSTLDLGATRWLYAGFWGGSIWKRRLDAHD